MLSFTLLLLLSVIASAVVDYFHASENIQDQDERLAECCSEIVTNLLDSWDIHTVVSTDDLYWNRRDSLRNLCREFNMEYLYIYTIDRETQVRRYLFCVASDEQKEIVVQRERSLGAIADHPLDPYEEAILAGADTMQKGPLNNQYGDEMVWLQPYHTDDLGQQTIIGMDYNIEVTKGIVVNTFLDHFLPFMVVLLLGEVLMLFEVNWAIIRPIGKISDSMKRFAEDSSKKAEKLNIRSFTEITEIASSFEKMTEDISAYVNNIEDLTKEKVENDVQLDVARRIQYGMVPERSDLTGDGFCFSAVTHPAKAVGGDFYDCFQLEKNKLCIFIGDVSGKGISAALFMIMAKALIREKLIAGCSPAQALNQINDELCAQNPEGLFATAFVAVLEQDSGVLHYANAGHTYPVLLKKAPSVLTPDCGIALGLFEDAGIVDDTLQLAPGEGILLYTDGLTDAVDRQNRFFGEVRLLETLTSHPTGEDAVKTVDVLCDEVARFCGGNEAFDDMAILVLYRTGPGPEETKLRLPVTLSSFDDIRKVIFDILGETGEARKVLLPCDEILTNIVSYSGAENLVFSCKKEGNSMQIVFADDGIPFNPTEMHEEEPDFEMLDMGGMGISLVRQSVSDMEYLRKDNCNLLTLHFEL